MRTLGHGKKEKDAALGALQCNRGEAPNAALRLAPTFAADSGQRTKLHAASATINARARPHAVTRRILSSPPFDSRLAAGRAFDTGTGKHSDNALNDQRGQNA